MKTIKLLIIILLTIYLASCTDSKNKPPLEVLYSFQYVKVLGGKPEKKNEIEFNSGNSYGWVMFIRTNRETSEIKDVLHLPSAGVWDESNGLIVSVDKKNAMSKRTMVTEKGIIHGGWVIAEGDPKGNYSEDIYVNNKLIKTFYYEIK